MRFQFKTLSWCRATKAGILTQLEKRITDGVIFLFGFRKFHLKGDEQRPPAGCFPLIRKHRYNMHRQLSQYIAIGWHKSITRRYFIST